MAVLKLTSIGTSIGLEIPEEMLADLKLKKGDRVFVTKTPGGYLLTPYDPEVEQQVEAGREIIKEYRESFRAVS